MTDRVIDATRQHGVSHEPESDIGIPMSPLVTLEQAMAAAAGWEREGMPMWAGKFIDPADYPQGGAMTPEQIAEHRKALEDAGYRVHRPHDWDSDFNYWRAWEAPNKPRCRRCGVQRPFLGDAGDCEGVR